MNGPHRPRAGRLMRVGAVALLALVCCVSAAAAVTIHPAKPAAKSASKPTSVVGLSAHVSLPNLAAASGSLLPPAAQNDNPVQPAFATSLGAGQYTVMEVMTASTTFTFPSTTCASNSDYEWLLPGLWIFDTSGNLVDYIFAEVNCDAGVKNQDFGVCIEGNCKVSKVTPNPGDVFEAVYEQDTTGALGFIDDRTQRATVYRGGAPLSAPNPIFMGDLGPAPFGVSAVPTFSTVPFSISTLDGAYIHDWFPYRFNLQTGSHVQIKSDVAKTTSFTTTWYHNN
jgi:hypothetical protein